VTDDKLLHRSIEHLHGPEAVAYKPDELIVVCLVRDGRPYVKSYVEHYLSLGVKHIAFLDNDSTDGTVVALKNYENVTVLRTKLPYKAGPGGTEYLFKKYLISRFGRRDRWCLLADIDELFDYPYSDLVGLESLLRYLNEKRYTAVVAQMLDMLPEDPLSGRAGNLGEPLKELHRFCDISNVKRTSIKDCPDLRGNTYGSDEIEEFRNGIRSTIFGAKPLLTKHPLMFLNDEVKPVDGSTHWVGNARVADFTCVLFHYKFLDGYFREQVARAVREEQYYENSAAYKKYFQVLASNPNLQIKQETAREIESVNDLVENRFLVVSEDYLSWVNAEAEKNALSQAALQSEPRGPGFAQNHTAREDEDPENTASSGSSAAEIKRSKVQNRTSGL